MEWELRYVWGDVARDISRSWCWNFCFHHIFTPWQVFRLLLIWIVPSHRATSTRLLALPVFLSLFTTHPLSQSSNIIQYFAKNHLLYRALHENEHESARGKSQLEILKWFEMKICAKSEFSSNQKTSHPSYIPLGVNDCLSKYQPTCSYNVKYTRVFLFSNFVGSWAQ
jgi:hypothetical protein